MTKMKRSAHFGRRLCGLPLMPRRSATVGRRVTLYAFPRPGGKLRGSGHEARVHCFVGLLGAVVERAEPFIQRDRAVGIVTLEIFVMKIVGIAVRIDSAVLPDDNLFEAGVPRHWR